MKAEYKRDLQNNYLILEVPEKAAEEEYQLRMAEQNEIPGLLSFHSARRDGMMYLHYEITSKQSLDSIYELKKLTYEDIFRILCGVREVLDTLRKYLLSPAQLVFDPKYIYTAHDRPGLLFCYLPGEQERSIVQLAEFILKKLDHGDRQAVAMGYGFYQRACEENFSLSKALRDILSSAREGEMVREKETGSFSGGHISERGGEKHREIFPEARAKETGSPRRAGNSPAGNRSISRNSGAPRRIIRDSRRMAPDGGASRGREKTGARLFQIIHPAVLLSALCGLAALGIGYYFGLLTLTEAGGLFFLIISVETLIHQKWKAGQEKRRRSGPSWSAANGARNPGLFQEMYGKAEQNLEDQRKGEQAGSGGPEDGRENRAENQRNRDGGWRTGDEEDSGETRYLGPLAAGREMRLIPAEDAAGGENRFPDIRIGTAPVCVGKKEGEADVHLPSPTVSRIHARLGFREGRYYVKDLNSRNGTFLNGQRLNPQEQRDFSEGDRIRFAEIEYKAVIW